MAFIALGHSWIIVKCEGIKIGFFFVGDIFHQRMIAWNGGVYLARRTDVKNRAQRLFAHGDEYQPESPRAKGLIHED